MVCGSIIGFNHSDYVQCVQWWGFVNTVMNLWVP